MELPSLRIRDPLAEKSKVAVEGQRGREPPPRSLIRQSLVSDHAPRDRRTGARVPCQRGIRKPLLRLPA